MPTYRYRCEGCGEEFERWQSITADPLRTHDDGCGGELVKVMTPAGIVLKGSGFYKTDNRSGSTRRDGGRDKSADKSSDKTDTSDSKSDGGGAKDATKSDSKTPSTSSSDGKSSTGAATS